MKRSCRSMVGTLAAMTLMGLASPTALAEEPTTPPAATSSPSNQQLRRRPGRCFTQPFPPLPRHPWRQAKRPPHSPPSLRTRCFTE